MLVSDVPEFEKDFTIVTVKPSDTVNEAIELLSQYNIGALPIVDDDNIVVGIISERDVIRKVLGNDLKPEDTLISDIMTKNPDTVLPHDDVFDSILSTIKGGYRHLIITDDKNMLISVLSHRDLAAVLWNELHDIGIDSQYTLGDFVSLKISDTLMTLSSDKMVSDAADLMSEGNFGAVPIVDDSNLVGIITERDVINRVIQKKFDYKKLTIYDIMTKNPDTVTRDTSLKTIAESMVFKKYRHLLIVDEANDSAVKSVLSLRDFVDIPYNIIMQHRQGEIKKIG